MQPFIPDKYTKVYSGLCHIYKYLYVFHCRCYKDLTITLTIYWRSSYLISVYCNHFVKYHDSLLSSQENSIRYFIRNVAIHQKVFKAFFKSVQTLDEDRMMNILSTLLSDKATDLVSGLIKNGFTKEQAEKFLPEAGEKLMSAMDNNESEMDADSILGKIDIGSLASKIGIENSLASTGLQQLIPVILGQLGGSELGGLASKVKSFF